jgi:hypothetical protein
MLDADELGKPCLDHRLVPSFRSQGDDALICFVQRRGCRRDRKMSMAAPALAAAAIMHRPAFSP